MRVRDLAVPAALAAVGVATMPVLDRFSPTDHPLNLTAVALILATAATTALRHRWPGPALLTTSALTSTYLIIGFPYGPILLSFAVCVYAVARHRAPRRAALWATPALLVLLIHLVFDEPLIGLAPGTAWVVVPFTLGAARRLVAEAQTRERAEAERRVADAERLRVAQEVHDVVGHGLAAIQMQADIALHLRDARPELALEALETISKASSEALDELRATLAGLSSPGLSGLEDLCARVRTAGVAVDLTVDGTPSPLPTAADVAAYRVLQEALTNVVKHADQPRARVTIQHRPDRVDLGVFNSVAAAGHSDGFGITGMRRRVEQLGGDLTASTRAGTFTLQAVIPRERRP
ncbi:two-component sensor histidine kinase [Paractinoplanes abujensis]|uniref:histidine kinase n=1 Tax=Paractinoplanes abujensis TaxID=882441 RepID=A0A7W7G2R4_9ACTN|nr:sensor histidine kinase [Actinoplanes abujensis]MBB4693939.1 signal transduction histidine kinase [Actinoplanes abujensis]GID21405.1 two-component sensor histidine kinase [Actinoplanes abujensis]